jgi:hypothetical protein
MSINLLKAAEQTIDAFIQVSQSYLKWEKSSRNKSKKSGRIFLAVFILIVLPAIFFKNNANWFLGFFIFALLVHYHQFKLSEMIGSKLLSNMEVYKSHFIALGFSHQILDYGFTKMKDIDFEYESSQDIANECHDAMRKEWYSRNEDERNNSRRVQ